MGINGLLTDVRWEWTGTELTTDLLTGATVLTVLDPECLTIEMSVWVGETGPYEITAIDVDNSLVTITPALTIDAESGTEVAFDVGSEPGRAWVCEVILPDADRPIEVPLTVHDLSVIPEGGYNPPVAVMLSDDLERFENRIGVAPTINAELLDPTTFPDAGITPIENFNEAVGRIEDDVAATYTMIAGGTSPASGEIDDAVAAYLAANGSVDSQVTANAVAISDAIQDFNNGLATKSAHTLSLNAPGTAANNAGDVWERYVVNGTTGLKDVIARWRGKGGTVWEPMNLSAVYIPQLDIGTGTFGDLTGTRIVANTVGVDKLLVGIGRNLAVNPGFETGVAPHFAQDGNNTPPYAPTTTTAQSRSGAAFVMRLGTNAATRTVLTLNGQGGDPTKHVRVVPGQQYKMSVWVRMYGTQAFNVTLLGVSRAASAPTANVAVANSAVTAVPTSGVWVQVSVEFTVPAGADFIFGALQVSPTVDDGTTFVLADDIDIQQKMGGELIVDGTVKAIKIDVNDLNAQGTIIVGQPQVTGLGASLLDASNTAISAGWLNQNPTFADWTGTIPNGYGGWTGNPTKETTLVRTAPYALRYTVALATDARGVTLVPTLNPLPFSDYVTVEADVYLVSGTSFNGAGILIDWMGITPTNRSTLPFNTIAAPQTGKWYRFTKTLKKPAGSSGTQTSWAGYIMANWVGGTLGAATAKDIIVDRVGVRPASAEEITAYESPAYADNAVAGLQTLWGTPGDTTKIAGGKISTRSIGTDALLVSDFTNYVADPNCVGFGWTFTGGPPLAYCDQTFPNKQGVGGGVLVFGPGATTAQNAYANFFEVQPGDIYNVAFDWRRNAAATGAAIVRIYWYDKNKVALTSTVYTDILNLTTAVAVDTWFTFDGADATVPNDAVYGRVTVIRYVNWTTGHWIFDNFKARRKFGGSLIVDGAILAKHITADMVAGLLFSGTPANPAVFQTDAAPNRGIKISTSGLTGYNSATVGQFPPGTAMTVIDPTTGLISVKGSFATATGGDDISIVPSSVYGPAALYFYSNGVGLDNTIPAALYMNDTTTTLNGTPSYWSTITFNGPKYGTIGGTGTRPRIEILTYASQANTSIVRSDINYHAGGSGGWKGAHYWIIDNNQIAFLDESGIMLAANKGIGIGLASTASIPTSGLFAIGAIKSSARIDCDTGFFDQSYNSGTGGPWTAQYNANGRIIRGPLVTSSARYKENIEDLTLDEAMIALDLRSVTFEWREGLGMDDRRAPGFIAEEVAEAGGDLWVMYDDSGEEPVINGVKYPELTAAHNVLIKDLYNQISQMKKELGIK